MLVLIEKKRRNVMKRLIFVLLVLLFTGCYTDNDVNVDPSLNFIIISWQQIFIDIDSDNVDDGFLFNVVYRVINNGGYVFDYLEAFLGVEYADGTIEIVPTGDCITHNTRDFSLIKYIENTNTINDVYLESYYYE
jgi:hypothetical protein